MNSGLVGGEHLAWLPTKTILVIDDEPDYLGLIISLLRKLGAKKVVGVSHPDDCLREIQAKQFDLLVIDWQLPIMSGGVLLQKVRKNLSYREVPVLFCSAYMSVKEVRLAIEFGVHNYVVKPPNVRNFSMKLQEAFEIGPQFGSMHKRLKQFSTALIQGEVSEQLVRELHAWEKKEPKLVRVKELLGDYYYQQNNLAQAITYYEQVLDQQPNNIKVQNKLAQNLYKSGEAEKATILFEKLNALSPDNIDRLITMGDNYLEGNQHERAERVFRQANRLDPESEAAKNGLGKTYFAQAKYSKAFEFLKDSERGKDLASYFNNLAIALVAQQRFVEARRLYLNALHVLRDTSLHYVFLFNLGLTYKKKQDLQIAGAFFKVALDTNPSFVKARANLQEIFEQNGSGEDQSFDQWVQCIDTSIVDLAINDASSHNRDEEQPEHPILKDCPPIDEALFIDDI